MVRFLLFIFQHACCSVSTTGNGDYPDRVLKIIPEGILPRFTEADKKLIKGSADFYAIGN